jgi:large subunit ribosomal protein L32
MHEVKKLTMFRVPTGTDSPFWGSSKLQRVLEPGKEIIVAVPKRKMSRSNTRHRRSQWKATVPVLVTCANPECREKHLPHTACPTCGQYGPRSERRQVLAS